MVNSSVTRSPEVVCRAFIAPLLVTDGPPTAWIVGIGEGADDSYYLDSMQLDGEGMGARWPGHTKVKVVPLSVDERDRLFQPVVGSGWPGGLWFDQNDVVLEEFQEDSELRSLFPNPMTLVAMGNGRLYFREGDERGWPAGKPGGPNAFLLGKRSLILVDLDEAKSQYLLACATFTVSNLSIIAGCDSVSDFAARGHAHNFNPDAKTTSTLDALFSAEETTLHVEQDRRVRIAATLGSHFQKTIPPERRGSVNTSLGVRAAASGRTRLAELKALKEAVFEPTVARILPGFLSRLRGLSRIWAMGPERRMNRELGPMLDGLYDDVKGALREGVLQRLLGKGFRNRFGIDGSRPRLDAGGTAIGGGAQLAAQPEVDAESDLSPAEKIEALADQAALTELEQDLFLSMSRGESIPDWAQRRGPHYRMYLSDAKKLWMGIKAKISAAMS